MGAEQGKCRASGELIELGPARSVRGEGVYLGRLEAVTEEGLVVSSERDGETGVERATSLVELDEEDVGREVAFVYPAGTPRRAVVLGTVRNAPTTRSAARDEESVRDLEICGDESLTLRCGKASVTLRRDGKIELRGTHLYEHSTGPLRIKGGSVSIN